MMLPLYIGVLLFTVCNAESCIDIYNKQNQTVTGVYTFDSGAGPVSLFCDFYEYYGYTFISKNDLGKLDSLLDLYTETDHAIIRILYRNHEQHDVNIEQLSSYKYRYPLNFQLSDYVGFKKPLNFRLEPYIYVGFLPTRLASLKSRTKKAVQGYRTAGVDIKFNNCDRNPNSYIALFANPNHVRENLYYRRCCDNKRMREWINHAQPIPADRYLPEHFFYMFEMHMGGCGGYLTTSHTRDIIGVAVGLAF